MIDSFKCPKANIEGNLQDGQSPDEYTFTIPDDFTPGDYTFAWTWVNRIGGQPEFCKSTLDRIASFPQLSCHGQQLTVIPSQT